MVDKEKITMNMSDSILFQQRKIETYTIKVEANRQYSVSHNYILQFQTHLRCTYNLGFDQIWHTYEVGF